MKKTILTFTTLVIFILSACGLLTGSNNAVLRGTSWKLVSYGGKLPIAGKTVTANFEGIEVSGSASCNHYFGSYQVKGSQLEIEGLGWTEMACLDPEGIMEQEQQIMSLFSSADHYLIEGDNLEIETSDGKILVFERLSPGD